MNADDKRLVNLAAASQAITLARRAILTNYQDRAEIAIDNAIASLQSAKSKGIQS